MFACVYVCGRVDLYLDDGGDVVLQGGGGDG